MKFILLVLVMMSFAAVFTAGAQTVPSENWSNGQIKKWYKKKEWLGGLNLTPHKTVNQREFARQYRLNSKYWDRAFAFLKTHDLNTIEKGKYPVDGDNVTVSVTIDTSKDFNKTNWESHRKFVDLQYVINGVELMGLCPVADAKVTSEYNEKKDVANYEAKGKLYPATPAAFFLFFPSDAHRPNITPGGNKPVKKIVIKVRAA
jgi:YhcH/YjgK/YiaL family protein